MRVIAGEHRGRRLIAPDTNDTRPVTDRVKESVFSSLSHLIADARVVDLFAGAGSFGIEAMSRGAASVVFVENGRKAIEALNKNLETLGISALVRRVDVYKYDAAVDGPFDLVFCDPPWTMMSDVLAEVLEKLGPCLADGAVIMTTRRSSDPIPQPDSLRIDDERRFGDTRIIRYRKETT